MDEDEGETFAGLGWGAEIVSLANPHIPFNPSPKGGLSGAKRFRDEYEIIPFSQSKQAWKWRMEQEERKRYVEWVRMRGEKVPKKLEATVECDMFEAVDLSIDIPWTITEMDNEEESNDVEQEAEPKVEIPKVLLFHEKMKRLSLH